MPEPHNIVPRADSAKVGHRDAWEKSNDCKDFLDSIELRDDNTCDILVQPRAVESPVVRRMDAPTMCSLVPTRARYCVLALLSMLLVGSGCCLTPICRTGTGCSSCSESIAATGCDSCGGTCQSGCGNEEVYPGTCGTCVPGNCGGLSGLMLPLLSTRLACGSGCGGVYWNEWVSDPPVCCDPCNDCGCWVGPRCGDCGECGGCGGCGGVLRRGPLAVVGAA